MNAVLMHPYAGAALVLAAFLIGLVTGFFLRPWWDAEERYTPGPDDLIDQKHPTRGPMDGES